MQIKSTRCEIKKAGWLAAIFLMFALTACGSGGGDSHDPIPLPLFETQIFSDLSADGDIAFTPPDTYVVSSAQTTGSVLAGIDPVFGDEYRGFLDFYLGGTQGVPLDARIESAILTIFINTVMEEFPGAGVPLLIDLVSFQPPDLIAADFDRTLQPPLLSLFVEITAADAGRLVSIDVTSLMTESQILGLPDFQLRFLLDDIAAFGLVEIDDLAIETAPLLTVTYY